MTVSIICLVIAVFMWYLIHNSKSTNPNGDSIAIFQRWIARLDWILCKNRFVASLIFAHSWDASNPKNIEKVVWKRLALVSIFSIILEILHDLTDRPLNKAAAIAICIYVFILQISLLNSLLKPLFGVKRIGKGLDIDKDISEKKTSEIPTPKRSLLLALVNFFEIIVSWGIIYRVIMPGIVKCLDKANYFSIVTLTTVGYGDISGSSSYLVETAVSFNLIVFVIFSVCHITTILGTITDKK